MRKNNRFYLLSLFILGLFIFACSDDKENEEENPVGIENLPTEARSFLNKYYLGIGVKNIEEEQDGDISVFEVYLENGHQVVFNEEGEWQQVEAPFEETIPTGFILSEIMDYLNENFSGYGINEINRTGYGFKVQLVSELNLMFNDLGQYLGTVSDE